MPFKFEELKVWKEAIDFASGIYSLTRSFPPEEQFGITSQLRRSANSIALNIAEGTAEKSKREFKRFLGIALGSLYEAVTALYISRNEKFLSKEDFTKSYGHCNQIAAMLHALVSSLDR